MTNISPKYKKILFRYEFIFFTTILFLLFGCEADRHNYSYYAKNETEQTGEIKLTFSIYNTITNSIVSIPKHTDFFLCDRNDVTGDEIWNIETSTSMLMVSFIVAANSDSSKITEDLSLRSYWSGPTDINGTGVYLLNITDDLFVLERQSNYEYYIQNNLNDTIFITSQLTGKAKNRDTITIGEQKIIGNGQIYTYNQTLYNSDKYIEKKLSGISSLLIKYKNKSLNVNLTKSQLYNIQIEHTKCTFIIDSSFFKIDE